ncbi:MAG: alpha/beta hydrolase [Kofleriaceae bacterium]
MANLFTRASAAIDRGVVRFMERRMAPRTPKLDAADVRTKLIETAALYNAGTLGVSSPFFPAPPLPQVALAPAGDGPLGTQVIDLGWASEYAPFATPAREMFVRATPNLTAHARWWTSGKGRPTIVVLHGWGGGNHWVTARAFVVPYWLRHGYDVAAFVLPYHGVRAPGGGLGSSGALFPSPNPLRTNEGFGQAIFDLRSLAQFLRARGASAVGAMGMSLGGYTTSLWASIAGPDDAGGIDFAVAMIPAVSMAKLMWRHGENSPARARALKAGITEDLLVDAFAVHAPTTRPARLPRERLSVIAGRGDRITPPEQAEALAAHWGVPIAWFDGGHLAQVGRGDALRDVRRKLGTLGFAGREMRL